MRRRLISAAFLGVWLVLLAGDFCDDVGLFDDDDGTVDKALDAALADLGQAVDTGSDFSIAASVTARHDFRLAHPVLLPTRFETLEIVPSFLLQASAAAEPTNFFRERSTVLLL